VSGALRELGRSRDIYLTLVERQLRLRTKRSWISTAWPVLAPFFLMFLYVFVFKRVFNVPIERYPEYLLCGLLPWVFLSQTLSKSTAAVSTEGDILRKTRFPYELLTMSTVTVQAVNFVLTLGIFLTYLAVVGDLPYATLPALAFPLLALLLLVTSVAMILGLVDVYNHDLRQVLGNLLTIWFFLVPIVYRPRMAPESVARLQSIDPANLIVNQFRAVLYRGQIGEPVDLVVMFALCAGLFVVCLHVFRRYSRSVAKDV
jgi:lipopolysaccharide transport system permease protein